jgi:hypothetical protein
MRRNTALMAGIVAGSVTLGGVLGALAFAPVIGTAQEAGTAPVAGTAQEADDGVESRYEWCRGLGEGPIAVAANTIGIAPRELLEELADGRSIAEVSEEHGVEPSTVVDAIVANAEERLARAVEDGWLTQEQADEKAAELREHVTDLVNGELPAFGRGPWLGVGPGRGFGPGHGFGPGIGHGWGGPWEDGPTEDEAQAEGLVLS